MYRHPPTSISLKGAGSLSSSSSSGRSRSSSNASSGSSSSSSSLDGYYDKLHKEDGSNHSRLRWRRLLSVRFFCGVMAVVGASLLVLEQHQLQRQTEDQPGVTIESTPTVDTILQNMTTTHQREEYLRRNRQPVKLDEEGNNIHSPYYTDLDRHWHRETDPGDSHSLVKYMNASRPVPSLLSWWSNEESGAVRKNKKRKKRPMDTLVTIIGAGTAGLAAARRLAAKGINNVIILEADSRLGGRVLKDTSFLNGFPIELGAAVVHRPDLVKRVAHGRDFKYIKMPNGEGKEKGKQLSMYIH